LDVNTIAAVIGGAAAACLGGYMLLVEPFKIQLRKIDLSFPDLPFAFDGFTILHLSDFHVNKMGLLEKRLVDLISSLHTDVCVITGDVTVNPRAAAVFHQICARINADDPLYLVLGNSEHKPWVDTQEMVSALEHERIHMLINSSHAVKRGGQEIAVVGVDDPYSRMDDLKTAFDGVDPNAFILMLTHSPSVTPDAIRRGADLILSGHTHGGQVRFPGLDVLFTHMRANKALSDGLYTPDQLSSTLGFDAGGSALFVNRGIGTSRLHIRLLCPPEIAVITLRKAAA